MDVALQKKTKNSPAEDKTQHELRGTTVTKTTLTGKNVCTEPREMLRYLNRKLSQTKLGKNQEKCYAHRMPRYTNKALSTMQIQCRHGLRMCQSDISLDGNLPPCSRTLINATNTNKLMQQRYTQPIRHERTPKTLETIAPSPNYGLDTAMALTEYDRPFVNGL